MKRFSYLAYRSFLRTSSKSAVRFHFNKTNNFISEWGQPVRVWVVEVVKGWACDLGVVCVLGCWGVGGCGGGV